MTEEKTGRRSFLKKSTIVGGLVVSGLVLQEAIDEAITRIGETEDERFIRKGVGDLHHLFVGPVQREGLGLAGNNFPPENQGSVITELNKKVQLARLKATSTLRETELQTFETLAQALRDRFGL